MRAMTRVRRLATVAAAGGIAVTALAAPQVVTGPRAVYWIDATTEAGMPVGGGKPSLGDMMAMATGGGASSVRKSLWLRLGSDQPAGDPRAPGSHQATAALDAKPFPLLPPGRPGTAAPIAAMPNDPVPPGAGTLLVYWGCGVHAGPGQPQRIDLSKVSDPVVARTMAALLQPALGLAAANPPRSTGRRTYLEWPQPGDRRRLRAEASLVGRHVISAPASPTIDLTLGVEDDFLPPARVTDAPAADGALALSWPAIARAQAIALTAVGSDDGKTVTMWASSKPALAWMSTAPDFLTDRDQTRLAANGTLLHGTATSCTIPAEAAGQMKAGGLYRVYAYGRDTDRSWPPRPADPKTPWAIEWTAKVRHRSLASGMVGMERSNTRQGEEICGQECSPAPEKKKKRGGLLGRIRDITGQ